MSWVFVLALTTGLVWTVPAVLRAIDPTANPELKAPSRDAIGCALLTLGVLGLVGSRFETERPVPMLAICLATAIGAGGAYLEVDNALRRRNHGEPHHDQPGTTQDPN